jgi:hypothetical protein
MTDRPAASIDDIHHELMRELAARGKSPEMVSALLALRALSIARRERKPEAPRAGADRPARALTAVRGN